ncbi:hypothetical protein ENUP19_0301G0005 [Entamoeba nuttalli]|uniref:RBR-type E3 ubiquitin transferase n=2 Tax=Entamoeba nuttalli TaxID=412467 RepID=K2GY38_ENTNP|nr:IBR domain containing protein [Entamoeba nuttalli P19]EKE38722.1 IBR domain containing protein [Entamoeba nuttalli P19]|eukprot:XP_008858944.1 IBR domain containing protein [Entamoeba nuttalli P19]
MENEQLKDFIRNHLMIKTNEKEIEKNIIQLLELVRSYFSFECSLNNIFNKPKTEECPICFETREVGLMYSIEPCKHRFCLCCLIEHVKQKATNGEWEIKCPEQECETIIPLSTLVNDGLIQETNVLNQLEMNGVKANLRSDSHTRYCPKCGYAIIGTRKTPRIVCPQCSFVYCYNCKEEYHEGYSCKQYQQWKIENGRGDEEFKKYVNMHCTRCPRCKIPVEKIKGCNFIRCDLKKGGCGCGFCYACGKEVSHHSAHILKRDCSLSGEELPR